MNQARALAAFAVLICHVEQIKGWTGLAPNRGTAHIWVGPLGQLGIILFFILSAFLITFLLLQEQQKYDKIDVKKFYLRRIFRIWPLYFFVVLSSFFVLPLVWHPAAGYLAKCAASLPQDFWQKFALFTFFLPSICSVLYPPVAFASQCWSLGVEEQFYIFLPTFVIAFRKLLVWAAVGAIATKYATLAVIDYFLQTAKDNLTLKTLGETIFLFDADSFITGGLAAWLVINRPKLFGSWIVHPLTVITCAATLFVCINSPWSYIPRYPSAVSCLARVAFAVMIIALYKQPISLGFGAILVDYLGRISYGIYMYHWTVAVFLAQWLMSLHTKSSRVDNFLFYSLTILISVAISAMSYKYLEQPFLRMKKKFEIIKTV